MECKECCNYACMDSQHDPEEGCPYFVQRKLPEGTNTLYREKFQCKRECDHSYPHEFIPECCSEPWQANVCITCGFRIPKDLADKFKY